MRASNINLFYKKVTNENSLNTILVILDIFSQVFLLTNLKISRHLPAQS